MLIGWLTSWQRALYSGFSIRCGLVRPNCLAVGLKNVVACQAALPHCYKEVVGQAGRLDHDCFFAEALLHVRQSARLIEEAFVDPAFERVQTDDTFSSAP